MKASSNAILALSRSFYGKRLTNADFDALLHCSSVGEAAQFLLLKTPYADAIAESGVTSFTARFLEELVSNSCGNCIVCIRCCVCSFLNLF